MNWEPIYGRPATDLEGFMLETFQAAFRGARQVHLWPDVPPERLSEARRSFLFGEEDDWLIALADSGQGAHLGFAVTLRAIWWRNIGQEPGWAALAGMSDPVLRGTWLEFGTGSSLDVQTVDGSNIEALQSWCKGVSAACRDGVPWDFVRGWDVREKDEQRGPYTWRELAALLESGALLPYTSEARGPGLADWTRMVRIEEVKQILAAQKAPDRPREPLREASKRITARPQDETAGVKVALSPKPAQAARRRLEGAGGEKKTVGQVIDGLIESVRKRLGR
jgi:hypothetical protein